MKNKYDIQRAIENEHAFESIRHNARGKKPGELPTITREPGGQWHWWAIITRCLSGGRTELVHVDGVSASKRDACNARREAQFATA